METLLLIHTCARELHMLTFLQKKKKECKSKIGLLVPLEGGSAKSRNNPTRATSSRKSRNLKVKLSSLLSASQQTGPTVVFTG
jgi:hypothetical protein